MAFHIIVLTVKNGITVGKHSSGGRAWRKAKYIKIRPVLSSITYAVALHEIGHILGPEQNKSCLYSEAGAWKWAKENALVWTAPMEKTMKKSLGTYYDWAVNKWERGVKNRPTIPENEHYFWKFLGLTNQI